MDIGLSRRRVPSLTPSTAQSLRLLPIAIDSLSSSWFEGDLYLKFVL